jgi:hypothetical protein
MIKFIELAILNIEFNFRYIFLLYKKAIIVIFYIIKKCNGKLNSIFNITNSINLIIFNKKFIIFIEK